MMTPQQIQNDRRPPF